tara:strand:+ start:28152 stop:28700 length:549 start_codon:yes stop_codon:yes gene_type:complete
VRRWQALEGRRIMISYHQIDETVSRSELRQFGAFVLNHANDDTLPDYKTLDLMEIPKLVPHIWVYDLRTEKGRQRLLNNFTGSHIDDSWHTNLQGVYDMDFFDGNPILEQVGQHRLSCIENRHVGYSRRYIEYRKPNRHQAVKFAECLIFPCATNNGPVNWAIGCVVYEQTQYMGKSIFVEF